MSEGVFLRSKEEIVALVTIQINEGEILFNQNVISSEDLGRLERDSKLWHQKNRLILQTSFVDKLIDSEYCFFTSGGVVGYYTPLDVLIQDEKKTIEDRIHKLRAIIEQLDLYSDVAKIAKDAETLLPKNRKIFIVHGHNESIKLEVARTIEKLGFTAMILHEQSNSGDTIIEKFERNADEAGFAVVIVTKDDEGREIGKDSFECRPRQNVVFEMGFFIGKLGRSNVVCLLEEGLVKPSDIDGVVYTPLDPRGAWKTELMRELKCAGYEVDANLLFG